MNRSLRNKNWRYKISAHCWVRCRIKSKDRPYAGATFYLPFKPNVISLKILPKTIVSSTVRAFVRLLRFTVINLKAYGIF